MWSGGLGDFCGKPEGDPSKREAAGIVHGGAGILVLQGVEFLRNVLICGRLCLPKRMAEEGRPDAAGLQVRKLGNLAAESGGTCEDHGRLFLLEPAAVLAFEKLFAPKAAEGEESLEVGGAVLLLVHAEGELPCEGLGTLDTPEVRPKNGSWRMRSEMKVRPMPLMIMPTIASKLLTFAMMLCSER